MLYWVLNVFLYTSILFENATPKPRPQTSTAVRLYSVLNIFLYTLVLFEKPSQKPQPQTCTVVGLYSVLNVFLYIPGEGIHAGGLQTTDRHSKHHLTHTRTRHVHRI